MGASEDNVPSTVIACKRKKLCSFINLMLSYFTSLYRGMEYECVNYSCHHSTCPGSVSAPFTHLVKEDRGYKVTCDKGYFVRDAYGFGNGKPKVT